MFEIETPERLVASRSDPVGMWGEDMKYLARLMLLSTAGAVASTASADCALLTVADVEAVVGPGVMDISGDDASMQCYFLGGDPQATLIVQISDRSYYDSVSLPEPSTAVDVGDEGRSHVDAIGGFSVQFAQGDSSATLALRPVQTADRDYLGGLISLARIAAGRLE